MQYSSSGFDDEPKKGDSSFREAKKKCVTPKGLTRKGNQEEKDLVQGRETEQRREIIQRHINKNVFMKKKKKRREKLSVGLGKAGWRSNKKRKLFLLNRNQFNGD